MFTICPPDLKAFVFPPCLTALQISTRICLGLKGEKIPLISRIIAITDTYDVMTNGRPYTQAVSKEEALAEIRRCNGTQFDPHLVLYDSSD